jgi:hypothetical protein
MDILFSIKRPASPTFPPLTLCLIILKIIQKIIFDLKIKIVNDN